MIDGDSLEWEVTITSVTGNGWTFSFKQKEANPNGVICMWEAEGNY
jgi:hypothetical protein